MLTISNLVCRIAGRVLIDGASLSVMDGWRVGLVGLNGAGKSTLFRMIAGEMEVDSGDISLTSSHRMAMVRQDLPECDTPLLDLVLAADTERMALLEESETAHDPERVSHIYTRLNEIDAYTAPARASMVLSGLGFSEAQIRQPFSALSGGWRMRVALASVLFLQPDLLLLDEPTNHLDLEAIIWLEGYLAKYPHTLLIISHDRDLLNACTDHIAHLDQQKLTMYSGNYDTFERTRAERLELQQKTFEKQQAQRAHIQSFIDRFRYKASKARQAQSRIKMLEKMEQVDAVIARRAIRFQFPQPDKGPSPLMILDKVAVGYETGKAVLRNVGEVIDRDDRIALLGANGNGKSTLIKLIAGKLAVCGGEITKAQKLKIGYFSQHQTEELNMDSTPFLEMTRLCERQAADTREAVVRARLGQFGFSKELSDNKISSLSGGEKARLLFAFMSLDAPHLLLLDEPTNHLDIEARAALVEALNAYDGAVVIVSHDPAMLERVADRLWLVHGGGVQSFDGDMADYRRFVLEQQRVSRRDEKLLKAGVDLSSSPSSSSASGKLEQRKSAAQIRKMLAPYTKAMNEAEKKVEALLAEQAKLRDVLSDVSLYADVTRAQKLQQDYGTLTKKVDEAEAVWLEAIEAFETAKGEVESSAA